MITILYADHDKNDRELMDGFFSQYPDIELIWFSGGELLVEYVEAVEGDFVCYLILDTHMPGLGGIEALRKLRTDPRTSKTKALLMSPNISPAEVQAAGYLDAELVEKPLTTEKVNEVGTSIVEYCYAYLAD